MTSVRKRPKGDLQDEKGPWGKVREEHHSQREGPVGMLRGRGGP